MEQVIGKSVCVHPYAAVVAKANGHLKCIKCGKNLRTKTNVAI